MSPARIRSLLILPCGIMVYIIAQRGYIWNTASGQAIVKFMYYANALAARWFLAAVLFGLLNLGVILAFQPLTISGDSVSYFETAKLLHGGADAAVHPSRVLKPLGPYVAALLGDLFGVGVERGLLVENGLFYILMIPMIYVTLLALAQNQRSPMWGSILYLSSFPLLRHGIAYMTDFSGWFFTVAVIFLVALWHDVRTPRYALAAGVTAAIGLLFKEYVVAGGLFFGILLLVYAREQPASAFKAALWFAVPFLLIAGSWQVYSYTAYNASYLDWYQTGGVGKYMLRDIPFMLKSLVAVFLAGWVLAIRGARMLWRKGSARDKLLAASLIPGSLSFLVWHVASSRIYFVSGVLLAWLAGGYVADLYERKRSLALLTVGMVIAINYIWFIIGDRARPFFWPWIQ